MIRGGLLHEVVYRLLGVTGLLAGTAATGFSVAIKAKPEDIAKAKPVFAWALTIGQAQAWPWLFVCLAVAGLAAMLRRYMGPSWAWNLIDKMLSEFRGAFFKGLGAGVAEHAVEADGVGGHGRISFHRWVAVLPGRRTANAGIDICRRATPCRVASCGIPGRARSPWERPCGTCA